MTLHSPSDSAGVVPGRTTMASSALMLVEEYSQAMTTTLVPLRRASVSQWVSGIFVVTVDGIAGRPLQGVASLGVRPTVSSSGKPTLEVYIFDYAGDLYRAHLRVNFLHKLRDEAKFDSLDALTAQIARDVAGAKAYHAAQRF